MSGIASTGTGYLGRFPMSQSNGATIMPHPINIITKRPTTSLFSRQKRITLSISDSFSPVSPFITSSTKLEPKNKVPKVPKIMDISKTVNQDVGYQYIRVSGKTSSMF
jgi:hypothetical protein